MAVDMFLKLDGIKGEAADHKHKDEIDILSWSWGLSNTGSGHVGGGSGTGKVNVQDLSFTKRIDRATSLLIGRCANGTHIKEGFLYARKAGGDKPVEYLKIEMRDILVSSFQTSANGDEVAVESVSLNFSKVIVYYQPQKKDGSADGGTIDTGWDIKKNEKI
jgi:type VI secretion system secreted protein Hcp